MFNVTLIIDRRTLYSLCWFTYKTCILNKILFLCLLVQTIFKCLQKNFLSSNEWWYYRFVMSIMALNCNPPSLYHSFVFIFLLILLNYFVLFAYSIVQPRQAKPKNLTVKLSPYRWNTKVGHLQHSKLFLRLAYTSFTFRKHVDKIKDSYHTYTNTTHIIW